MKAKVINRCKALRTVPGTLCSLFASYYQKYTTVTTLTMFFLSFSHFTFTVSTVPHIDSLYVFFVPLDISEHEDLCFFLYTIFLDELKYSHNFNHLY